MKKPIKGVSRPIMSLLKDRQFRFGIRQEVDKALEQREKKVKKLKRTWKLLNFGKKLIEDINRQILR